MLLKPTGWFLQRRLHDRYSHCQYSRHAAEKDKKEAEKNKHINKITLQRRLSSFLGCSSTDRWQRYQMNWFWFTPTNQVRLSKQQQLMLIVENDHFILEMQNHVVKFSLIQFKPYEGKYYVTQSVTRPLSDTLIKTSCTLFWQYMYFNMAVSHYTHLHIMNTCWRTTPSVDDASHSRFFSFQFRWIYGLFNLIA